MEFESLEIDNIHVELSKFEIGSVFEYHAIFKPAKDLSFDEQYSQLNDALESLLLKLNIHQDLIIFKKFFISGYKKHNNKFVDHELTDKNFAVSVIEEPPLDGSEINAWVNFVKTDTYLKKQLPDKSILFSHNGYDHIWHSNIKDLNYSSDSWHQTDLILSSYINSLRNLKLNLKEHCLRTWFYVNDIRENYKGMVDSRKETFEKEGLTRDTHFIASTGIEGRRFEDNVYVSLDAYAVKGIASNQVNYLHVPDHMNPTHEYGVTFERGSTVDYGDRRHVFISGTASIDNNGIILHLNDAEKQLSRIISNINALLTKADATFSDVAEFIVYLRDAKDYDLVNKYLHSRFPQIPKVIVLAAVCRPDWLVEIECIAVKKVKNEGYADY